MNRDVTKRRNSDDFHQSIHFAPTVIDYTRRQDRFLNKNEKRFLFYKANEEINLNLKRL